MTARLALLVAALSACAPGAVADAPDGAAMPGAPDAAAPPAADAAPPSPGPDAAPPPGGEGWRTAGNRIIAPDGQVAVLHGVAWFGFETGTFVLHGLWQRPLDAMLDQMAGLGFNLLRVPYSNEMLHAAAANSINYAANPDLEGLTPLELLDQLVARAGARGIRILLDRHRPTSAGQSELWYTDAVSEEQWIADWVMLATRYAGNDDVVGADLHNEPHGAATWGSGDAATDWRLAAERAGDAILAVNPRWLIVVEGVERHDGVGYWWGGNLAGVAAAPVRLAVEHKVVYSTHDYGPGVFNQPWFSDPAFPANLEPLWEARWSTIHTGGVAPVLVGEFGGRQTGTDTVEGVWQNALVDYIAANDLYWTYWCWNPNGGDTGGVLLDDWTSVDTQKAEMLQRIMDDPFGP